MKNNFFIFLLIYLFSINLSSADQFKFKTSEIEFIDNGNIIYAKNGKALSIDGNLEIEAKNFEYIKDDNILKAFSGVAYFKKDNLGVEPNLFFGLHHGLNPKPTTLIALLPRDWCEAPP